MAINYPYIHLPLSSDLSDTAGNGFTITNPNSGSNPSDFTGGQFNCVGGLTSQVVQITRAGGDAGEFEEIFKIGTGGVLVFITLDIPTVSTGANYLETAISMPGGKNATGSKGFRLDIFYKNGTPDTAAPRAIANAETSDPLFTADVDLSNTTRRIGYYIRPSAYDCIGWIDGQTMENGRSANMPLFGDDWDFALSGTATPNVILGCLQLNTGAIDNADSFFTGGIKEFGVINLGDDYLSAAQIQKAQNEYWMSGTVSGVNL